MTGHRSASLAEPILICGILGGLLGGLNCCCWFAPLASSFFAVRWSRNLRGPTANVTGAGVRATLISAMVMATFGTAVYLYMNDPSRMSADQLALLESVLGSSGMSDLPMGAMAAGHAVVAAAAGVILGFVGVALAGGGAKRSSRSPSPGSPSRPATPATPAAPAVAAPATPETPATPSAPEAQFGSAARFLDAGPEDFASTPSEEQAWSDPDEE